MAKEVLECSFCGRKKPETNLLIAGISAHICDRCIEQAHGIVLEEIRTGASAKSAADLVLKHPKAGKTEQEITVEPGTAKLVLNLLFP